MKNESEYISLRSEVRTVSNVTPLVGASLISESKAMREVLRMVGRVVTSDVPILITGESGVGKDLIAELIHTMSLRGHCPLVKVDCSTLPVESVEAELFGEVTSVRGRTQRERPGLLFQAQSGTIVLDRLSELPVTIQSKLARVSEKEKIFLLQSNSPTTINCRLVATIQRHAEELIRDGKLREDLYYEISAISLLVPPLRDRREDILPLANSFLKRFAAQTNRVISGYTPAAAEMLRKFDWPGNVRQLQNEVQRTVLMCEGEQVDVQDLSISAPRVETPEDETNLPLMEAMKRNAIIQMLKQTGGNKLETAKRLGIGRQTLYN